MSSIAEFSLYRNCGKVSELLILKFLSGYLVINGLYHCYSCHSGVGGSIVNNLVVNKLAVNKFREGGGAY